MVEQNPERGSMDNMGFGALVTGIIMVAIGFSGAGDKSPAIAEAARNFALLGAVIALAGLGAIALARRERY